MKESLKQLPNVLVPVSVAGATFLTRRELAARWRMQWRDNQATGRDAGILQKISLSSVSAKSFAIESAEVEGLEAGGSRSAETTRRKAPGARRRNRA